MQSPTSVIRRCQPTCATMRTSNDNQGQCHGLQKEMGQQGRFQPPCYISRSKKSVSFQISDNLSHASLMINRGEAQTQAKTENRCHLLKFAIETPLIKLFNDLKIPDTILDKGV